MSGDQSIPRFGVVAKRRIEMEPHLPGLQATMSRARDAYVVRAGYDAATTNRLVRTRTDIGGTADSHVYTSLQLYNLRENAREVMRNHPILGQLVRRFADNVLGTGLVIDPETSSEPWNRKAQRLWEDWCNDPRACDLAKRRSFDQLERLALIGATVDGDMFAILDDLTGAVKLVEADNVTGTDERRNALLGVELDADTDEHLAYWFRVGSHVTDSRRRGIYANDALDPSGSRRIPARRGDGLAHVVQIMQDDYRVSANRGITFLAPVFERCSVYQDTEWAQLVQQQIAACVAVFIESEYPPQFGADDTETVDGYTAALEELTPGLIARLRKGEKISSVEPKGPNSDSRAMLLHVVREIGLQLDMPIEIALLQTSDTTFHGYRGALQQARKSFERRQQNFGRSFRGEIYRRKVADWIAQGILKDRRDKFAYRIQGPAWPYVDPKTDAEADTERLNNGSISMRRLHRERGSDWNRVALEIVEDNRALIEAAAKAADEINSAHPNALVHWRDLANRSAPAGVPQINLGPDAAANAAGPAPMEDEPND